MRATAKLGFAILVAAILFLNPALACGTGMLKADGGDHSCCPKQGTPANGQKADCGCMAVPLPPVAATSNYVRPLLDEAAATPVPGIVAVVSSAPAAAGLALGPGIPFTPPPLFVTFHQFLI